MLDPACSGSTALLPRWKRGASTGLDWSLLRTNGGDIDVQHAARSACGSAVQLKREEHLEKYDK